ncbi:MULTISPECIES: helix-turn-helix transcriptional regulator [unclassified Photorhabdus]|uniref:helix-turn-helix transcriptional regulator n=1 Tax=unclassified Photorhabdus TaxID=2620880 RepID=UPI000DCC7B5E|nr:MULTISPECIES: PAS domain-containing protein [unclassified Photorhabdus]RAX01130.1 helix-turn-helix transcriptional regulator [Photorhabdus sp. S9-53]RAX01627.1 helix-turn-helix transcriptional regulator [Photorhabdus sp. S10-54]RAX05042.1 helix-turn-helix transcriptional regulator [Photorhabdus sp. S8-52]
MKTANNISAQIINTIKNSHDPWGIKDKSTCFIYENKAMAMLQDIPLNLNVEGRFDCELPWAGAIFEEQFQRHDRTVMRLEKSISSLETHRFGKEKHLSSYFFEKFPFYNEDNECIGIIFHGRKAEALALKEFFNGKLPPSIMFCSPSEQFSQQEWEIIFLFLAKHSKREISERLNIPYQSVKDQIEKTYQKLKINSDSQFEEYCRMNNFNLYIPERFLFPYS